MKELRGLYTMYNLLTTNKLQDGGTHFATLLIRAGVGDNQLLGIINFTRRCPLETILNTCEACTLLLHQLQEQRHVMPFPSKDRGCRTHSNI